MVLGRRKRRRRKRLLDALGAAPLGVASVRLMGLGPALEAPDPPVWEGAPKRTGGMLGLCADTAAFKPFGQPC